MGLYLVFINILQNIQKLMEKLLHRCDFSLKKKLEYANMRINTPDMEGDKFFMLIHKFKELFS